MMKRGVRHGSKEGPLLFNLTFQHLLEEALSSSDPALNLITAKGERWTLIYLKFADDLILVSDSLTSASEQLSNLSLILKKYGMEIALDKTHFMCVAMETDVTELDYDENHISRDENFKNLGSIIDARGDPTPTLTEALARRRRQLFKLRPVLHSHLDVRTKERLLELFVGPPSTMVSQQSS